MPFETSPQASRPAPGGPGERLRIAFCIDNMQVGGTELNAIRTAERLDRARYDLRVVSLQDHGPLLERYAAAGVPVDCFPLKSLYGPGALRQGLRLRAYLRAHRIRILHAHDIYSLVFAIPWARSAGVRAIASRRWWEPYPGVHWRAATRLAYALADVTLANSARVARLVTREEHVPPERVVVVPNFVDPEAFAPLSAEVERRLRAELGIDEGDRVVGMVANLRPIKDQPTLLRAVALVLRHHPDVRLVLVGDGPSRPGLAALARELAIESRVVFAGKRPNVPNLHALFEVSVLSSTSEALPNSLLEALAAARPVVATDVGAVPDIVVEGENGLLVPPGDADRLAQALRRLLDDPALGRRMGEAGRRRAETGHTAEVALGALERLYAALVDESPQAAVGRRSPASAVS